MKRAFSSKANLYTRMFLYPLWKFHPLHFLQLLEGKWNLELPKLIGLLCICISYTEVHTSENHLGIYIYFLILFYFKILHNCISFAKYQNESATGIHVKNIICSFSFYKLCPAYGQIIYLFQWSTFYNELSSFIGEFQV